MLLPETAISGGTRILTPGFCAFVAPRDTYVREPLRFGVLERDFILEALRFRQVRKTYLGRHRIALLPEWSPGLVSSAKQGVFNDSIMQGVQDRQRHLCATDGHTSRR